MSRSFINFIYSILLEYSFHIQKIRHLKIYKTSIYCWYSHSWNLNIQRCTKSPEHRSLRQLLAAALAKAGQISAAHGHRQILEHINGVRVAVPVEHIHPAGVVGGDVLGQNRARLRKYNCVSVMQGRIKNMTVRKSGFFSIQLRRHDEQGMLKPMNRTDCTNNEGRAAVHDSCTLSYFVKLLHLWSYFLLVTASIIRPKVLSRENGNVLLYFWIS